MKYQIDKIDKIIGELNMCKTVLSAALVDNNESVSSLIKKINVMIGELETSKASMETNRVNMNNQKVW